MREGIVTRYNNDLVAWTFDKKLVEGDKNVEDILVISVCVQLKGDIATDYLITFIAAYLALNILSTPPKNKKQ